MPIETSSARTSRSIKHASRPAQFQPAVKRCMAHAKSDALPCTMHFGSWHIVSLLLQLVIYPDCFLASLSKVV